MPRVPISSRQPPPRPAAGASVPTGRIVRLGQRIAYEPKDGTLLGAMAARGRLKRRVGRRYLTVRSGAYSVITQRTVPNG